MGAPNAFTDGTIHDHLIAEHGQAPVGVLSMTESVAFRIHDLLWLDEERVADEDVVADEDAVADEDVV